MKYFAYGSNMSVLRLRERTPSVRALGTVSLAQHQLRFHKVGLDGSAKCDAYHTGDDQDQVIGVLYEMNTAEKPTLDLLEGLGRGYNDKSVVVSHPGGEQSSAFTYYATHIDPTLSPYDWYHHHVMVGAAEAQLPAAYYRELAAIRTIIDPNPARRARETAIYCQLPRGSR